MASLGARYQAQGGEEGGGGASASGSYYMYQAGPQNPGRQHAVSWINQRNIGKGGDFMMDVRSSDAHSEHSSTVGYMPATRSACRLQYVSESDPSASEGELSSINSDASSSSAFRPVRNSAGSACKETGADPAGKITNKACLNNMSIIFPRRKQAKNGAAATQGPVLITLEVLTTFAHMPLGAAAKLLGISATALKKACRKLGNSRWPVKLPTPPAVTLPPSPVSAHPVVPYQVPSLFKAAPSVAAGALPALPNNPLHNNSIVKDEPFMPAHLQAPKQMGAPLFWREDWKQAHETQRAVRLVSSESAGPYITQPRHNLFPMHMRCEMPSSNEATMSPMREVGMDGDDSQNMTKFVVHGKGAPLEIANAPVNFDASDADWLEDMMDEINASGPAQWPSMSPRLWQQC